MSDSDELLSPVPYSFVVLTRDERQFSIHPTEAKANMRAESIGGTVKPFTLNHTAYWNTGAQHYDH